MAIPDHSAPTIAIEAVQYYRASRIHENDRKNDLPLQFQLRLPQVSVTVASSPG